MIANNTPYPTATPRLLLALRLGIRSPLRWLTLLPALLLLGLLLLLAASPTQAQTASTTTLALTAASVPIGKATTLTATVSPTAATGSVTFKDAGVTLGAAPLSAGKARLPTSFTTLGVHSLSAIYAGTTLYATSTSAAKTQTVAAISTSTALASSLPSTTVGQTTTLSVTVTPSALYGSLTGTVTFKDGSTVIGMTPLVAGTLNTGIATLLKPFSSAVTHSLSAVFAANGNYATSTSPAFSQTVSAAPTVLALSAAPSTAIVNQTVTLSVTVTPGTANGSIVFKDGATTLGTVAVTSGVSGGSGSAILAKKFTTAGLHSLSATFAGNTNYLAASATPLSYAVNGVPGSLPNPPASPDPVVSQTYDIQGNPLTLTIAPSVAGLSFTTATNYDALSRAVVVTDAANGTTQRSYDGGDRVTAVVDPKSLTTQYQRDGLGQTTLQVSPDTGSTGMSYDAGGRLLTRTDSRGVLTQYSYDALSRITGTTLSQTGVPNPPPPTSYTWTYDQTGGFYTNGIGRLTSITYPEGSASYAYDALGRLTTVRHITAPDPAANPLAVVQYTAYGYDSMGHLASMVYPSGRTLSLSYANGQPSAISLAKDSSSGATPLITNVQFAPFGGPKGWNWVMNSGINAGAVAHTRRFDLNARLTRYPLGEYLRDVAYDAAGRITSYQHYVAATGSAAPAQDQQFGYDALERLTQATTAQASWTYTYDANGNRTGVAISNGAATATNAYTVAPSSNRLTSITTPAVTLSYDAAGNTVSDGAYTLGYDLRGRLSTLSQGGMTTSYAYDNAGQRVRKHNNQGAANTALFVYDPSGQLLGEYDSTGAAIREYVWLGNIPMVMFTPDASLGVNAATAPPLIYYIHADHINAPRVVVDKNNAVRWRWMGEPFGTQAPETSPTGQAALTFNLRMPGQFYDAESGLFYNMNRYLVPGIGGYSQSDPIGLAGGINTYGYSGANPVSYSDPKGLATNMSCRPMGFGLVCGNTIIPVDPTEPGGQQIPQSVPQIPWPSRTGIPLFDLVATTMNAIASSVSSTSSNCQPSAADCSKAIKLLEQVERLAQKLGKNLPPKRIEELRRKISDGTITSNDLPGSIQQEFPQNLRGMTLNDIRALCGKSR